MVLVRNKLNCKFLFCFLIANVMNIQLSTSLPVVTSKYSASSISKGQSHVSFTLFKRVPESEWNEFVKARQSSDNTDVLLLLVANRPGIIPVSHYEYKIQHPSQDNSIANRIQFTDPFDPNFDRQPTVPSVQTKQKIPTSTKRPSGSNSESAIIFPGDDNWTTTRSTTTTASTTSQSPGHGTGNRDKETEMANADTDEFDEFIKWANSGTSTASTPSMNAVVLKTSTPDYLPDLDAEFSLLNAGRKTKCRPGQRLGPNGICRKVIVGLTSSS